MNEKHERLQWVIKQTGLTKRQFSEKIGCQPAQLSNATTGYRGISATMLRGIANLGINTNWLLTGEGEPFSHKVRETGPNTFRIEDNYATVQQYDVIASAGYGSFIHGETGEEVLVRTEWLPNSAAQRNLSCIKISGDSMLPTIGSDDHVVHELDQRYSGPGLYVVRHRDTLLCKRLEVLLNGNIKIKSDNQVYSEEVLQNDDPDAEQFAIIGRVRLIMRKP
jgi:phage repressor protein C with HTH and peptisase S24 domain